MILLLSADPDWGIGRGGDLLFRTKGDMSHFRTTTTGGTVIMGRKTLESLPGGQALPKRENIVLTRNPDFAPEGVVVCREVADLLHALEGKDPSRVFVIGGEEVARLLLPYCHKAIITRWQVSGDADCFLPNLDALTGWKLIEQSPLQQEGELTYRFCTYLQKQPKL